MIAGIVIFVLAYIAIASEKIDKTIAAPDAPGTGCGLCRLESGAVPGSAGAVQAGSPYFGTPAVDKKDLDALIDAEKARLKAEREEAEVRA
jgi:hypothetical protein